MIENFFRKCLLIGLTFVTTVTVIPLLVAITIPVVIWRFVVILLAKGFRNDFLRPTSILSNLYAVEKIYEKPRGTILVIQHFNGPVSTSTLQNRVEKLIASGKRPELLCDITRWLGNFFLKKCPNFDLDKHIKVNNNASTEEEFDDAVENLVSGPWERNKPRWEFNVFPNYKNAAMGSESTIIFRFHHSLMDGISAHCFATDVYDPDPQYEEEMAAFIKAMKKKYTPSPFMKILSVFYLIFIAPFTTMYKIIDATETNIWTFKNSEQSGETIAYVSSNEVDIPWLKIVGKKVGKNITCLLTQAFSSALRDHFIEKGGKNGVKRDIHALYAIPGPGHPGNYQLTNYFFPEILTFPISEPDRNKRMEIISGQFRKMMTTPQPIASYIFGLMFALLCGALNTFIPHVGGHCCSFIYSNMVSATRSICKLDGIENIVVVLQSGVHNPVNSLYFFCVSQNDNVAFTMRADKKIFPDKESCKRFVDRIVQELYDIDRDSSFEQIVVK